MKSVNQPIKKRDGMDLVTGKPVYTDDIAPDDALIIKILRSPHAFARIKSIDKARAEQIEGVACILTYKDVPQNLTTRGGATFPQAEPYDFRILDEYVKYVGDEVAIVAADTEANAIKAMRFIKVDYEVLEPVVDFEDALEHKSKIHGKTGAKTGFDVNFDETKNICATYKAEVGSVQKGFEESDVFVEGRYYSQAVNQMAMEPHKAFAYIKDNRLVVVGSTQVPFHARRHLATALGLSQDDIRVIKPRIGGGFGAKQTVFAEFYPAVVTWITKRPSKVNYTRTEVFKATSRRHRMRLDVKVGATKDGKLKAIEMTTLSDTGAFGEHGWTTTMACGDKIMSFYNKVLGAKFDGTVVFTNKSSSGAFRGFGKSQGSFALESTLNRLAKKIHMDPTELRLKNIIKKGENLMLCTDEKYADDIIRQDSCELEYCINRGKEMIGWDHKYPMQKVSDTIIRGVGMGITIQGSGVLDIDSGGANVKLLPSGRFVLGIGATDMGTGCDTILPQMLADELDISVTDIDVVSADTDLTPYDDGSYASSTTYVTGNAVRKAGAAFKRELLAHAKAALGTEDIVFENRMLMYDNKKMMIVDFCKLMDKPIEVTESNICRKEAPPYKSSFAEVEVDLETGHIKVIKIAGVVDCGTVINTNLARVQAHGGMMQAAGQVLFEKSQTNEKGKEIFDNLLKYKIPSRKDDIKLEVEFADSYEPTGPFGAKSIGEVVLNATIPALSDAIANATGCTFNELPITPEKVLMALKNKEK